MKKTSSVLHGGFFLSTFFYVSTDLTTATEIEQKSMIPLSNEKHESFCLLFVGENEFFGNGIESYAEVYDVDLATKGGRAVASQGSTRLLKDPTILKRIDFLLENNLGFNDQFVDKQLAFLITQSADLRTKLASIKEYNALKNRIKHKLELEFTDKTDNELEEELHKLTKEISVIEAIRDELDDTSDLPRGMPVLTDEQKLARQSQQST